MQRLATDSGLPNLKLLSPIERADFHLTIVRRITDVLQYAGDETPLSLTDVIAIFESFMKISTGENYELRLLNRGLNNKTEMNVEETDYAIAARPSSYIVTEIIELRKNEKNEHKIKLYTKAINKYYSAIESAFAAIKA
ncbi:hypothetical protein ABLB90_14825 [Photorhabdus bodei]|uniref:hypothetical protein n=1 Tax=Photorhabdus bodei TaxID=2029681 RepID=UPI0032B756F7